MEALTTKPDRPVQRGTGITRTGKQTKFQEVFRRIAELAHELGPDAKLPTVLALRDRFDVSIATLNLVLGELETQRIVRRRHGIGIYVSPGIGQHNIALICDPSFLHHSGSSPFWILLIEQLRQRAEAQHELVTLHFATDISHRADAYPSHITRGQYAPGLPLHLQEEIQNGRIDGVIGIGLPLVTAVWIEEKAPLVAFAGPGTYTFGLDTSTMEGISVNYLATHGCRRIAHWSAVAPYRYHSIQTETNEVSDFYRSMQSQSLTVDPDLIWDNQHLIPADGGYLL